MLPRTDGDGCGSIATIRGRWRRIPDRSRIAAPPQKRKAHGYKRLSEKRHNIATGA
jgi:hypothetical protein